jgi:hypothetical protein
VDGVCLLKIRVDDFYSSSILTVFDLCIVQMEAVYIPEEDRCTDILSLVEDEDNLKYLLNNLLLDNHYLII